MIWLSLFVPENTARCRWDRPVNTIQINGLPMSLAFHAFDPHMVIANESDMITYVSHWDRRCPSILIHPLTVYGIGSRENG